MADLLPALIVAIIFYALIPLSGAFPVRRKWRKFRQQIVKASLCKEVSYSDPVRSESGPAGTYSFIGELQAIQDDSCIWLNNGKTTVMVDLKSIKLYLLPTIRTMENEGRVEENKVLLPQDMPKRIKWESVYSLNQGTGFLLYGEVFMENGTPVFRQTEEVPLLAIIYDGKKESILRRSIWSGRQLNEYWNALTPPALIAGSFFLFVLAFVSFRRPETAGIGLQLIVLTFIPLVPFFPPGILLYFLYRKLWRGGRYLRGERDLMRLMIEYPEYEEVETCAAGLEKYPDVKIRSCGMIDESTLMKIPCRVYRRNAKENPGGTKSLYENLIIPGDPEELAEKCRSRARCMEILAAASGSFGFIINILLFYFSILWFF